MELFAKLFRFAESFLPSLARGNKPRSRSLAYNYTRKAGETSGPLQSSPSSVGTAPPPPPPPLLALMPNTEEH